MDMNKLNNTQKVKRNIVKSLATLCLGLLSIGFTACDDDLDVTHGAVYTIRYFQYDGEGTLKLDNGLVLQPNDRYLLENEKFRLYYTSECDESQSLTITVEDNFGNACEWELEFNNDSDEETEESIAVSDTLNVSR